MIKQALKWIALIVLYVGLISALWLIARWLGIEFGPYSNEAQSVRPVTVWDLLELFIVPLVLVLGSLFLDRAIRHREEQRQRAEKERDDRVNKEERRREQEHQAFEQKQRGKEAQQREQERHLLEEERYQKTNLREFLDRIEKLLIEHKKNLFLIDEPARATARARVKNILYQADDIRKEQVIDFLFDSRLIIYEPERKIEG